MAFSRQHLARERATGRKYPLPQRKWRKKNIIICQSCWHILHILHICTLMCLQIWKIIIFFLYASHQKNNLAHERERLFKFIDTLEWWSIVCALPQRNSDSSKKEDHCVPFKFVFRHISVINYCICWFFLFFISQLNFEF